MYKTMGKVSERTEEEKAEHEDELTKLSLSKLRQYQAINKMYLSGAVKEVMACKDPEEKKRIEERIKEYVIRDNDYLKAILAKS